MNQNTIPFIDIIAHLEKIITFSADPLNCINLLDKSTFLEVREQIVAVFDIGGVDPFLAAFDEECEYGDISDAVIETCITIYPRDTKPEKLITVEERMAWCSKVIKSVDRVATY
jgi:hypothetical protein